jgi:hypothetical protein
MMNVIVSGNSALADNGGLQDVQQTSVTVEKSGSNRRLVRTLAPVSTILVISQIYYPG